MARLEKVASNLSAEKTKQQRKQVPRDLSVSFRLPQYVFIVFHTKATVREAYNQICEDDCHWDFSVWFVINKFHFAITWHGGV